MVRPTSVHGRHQISVAVAEDLRAEDRVVQVRNRKVDGDDSDKLVSAASLRLGKETQRERQRLRFLWCLDRDRSGRPRS